LLPQIVSLFGCQPLFNLLDAARTGLNLAREEQQPCPDETELRVSVEPGVRQRLEPLLHEPEFTGEQFRLDIALKDLKGQFGVSALYCVLERRLRPVVGQIPASRATMEAGLLLATALF
jgi:hypothetical protein